MRKVDTLPTKNALQRCILVVVATGFEEAETVALISILRQSGLCIKSVGMTSGLVSGAYGLCLMPDLTLTDIDRLAETMSVSAVILPENKRCLTRLEADPRLHNLLKWAIAQKSIIAVGPEGVRFLRTVAAGDIGRMRSSNGDEPLLLRREPGESIEALAHDLARRLEQPLRL
jgi:hypothetical protein